MQVVAMTYAAYQAADWAGRSLVRGFRKWDAWAATCGARPALLLDEYVRHCVTVCLYDTLAERAADIVVLQTLPDAPPTGNRSGSGGNPPPTSPALAAALLVPKPPIK